MTHTTSARVEGPVMSLDLNKDNSKIAAAGRRAFKIFSIDEDNCLTEEMDIRGTGSVTLNYSFNDVTWNWKEEHLLATAATNGAIVTWNLNKDSISKQDRILVDHKRTVNRVNFHGVEPWLISGSQDGTVRCFDLRTKEPGRVYNSNTDSVRDVKWSPHVSTNFAAVSENGSVQLWDTRRQDKYYTQFAAHSEPVFSCDWHPDFSWLATSSRDKSIKVWDVSPVKPLLKYIIHTISSVGRIKWRPFYKYHIASTALVVDRNVNVWDVRRPYIPYACFVGHKDIATDIKWKTDAQYLISAGRDGCIIHHDFVDTVRPANNVNPQALSLNNRGDILYGQKINANSITKSSVGGGKIQGLLRRPTQSGESFYQVTTQLYHFTAKRSSYADEDAKFFLECAVHYMLGGKPLDELCEYNALVANQLGRYNVSFLWEVVKEIFTTGFFEKGNRMLKSRRRRSSSMEGVGDSYTNESDIYDDDRSGDSEPAEGTSVSEGHDEDDDDRVGSFDEDEECDSGPHKQPLKETTGRALTGDFLFGDKDMDPLSLDCDGCENVSFNMSGIFADKFDFDENDWNIPVEAFAPKHEIKEGPLPPELLPTNITSFSKLDQALCRVKFVQSDTGSPELSVRRRTKFPVWNSSALVATALLHHANEGDFQTAVCVLLVLGDKRWFLTKRGPLDESTQEQWLLAYIDMLVRHRLWNITTKVIQHSWISEVYELNQQSTSVRTSCSRCRRLLVRKGWLCHRCRSTASSVCSVCHKVVKGVFVWCQGCTHGGHLVHMRSWFKMDRFCPTGCGHICEY